MPLISGFNIVFHLHGLIDQHGVSRLDFLTTVLR